MTTPSLAADSAGQKRAAPNAKRVLWVSCVAHALHDGYTDLIYVLLPVWQTEFGLGYGALAILRAVYGGTMACLQLSAGRLAQWIGRRATLALGTLLAALGYAAAGMSGSLLGLCVALAVSGSGSSTQHPLASAAVSHAFGQRARGPLGIYNFAGDLGKAALPAAMSLLVAWMPWRHALWVMAVLGALVAAGIALFLPPLPRTPTAAQRRTGSRPHASSRGFQLLLTIGVLDTAVRMGMLTFLPFLLQAKGISPAMLGTAFAMVFIGGAAGKFVCGWLGERLGVTGTVLVTEGGTVACIVAVLLCPLGPALMLLPLLGLMLNGTSSVLYGTVPETASPEGTEHAFAVFYTGTIASGAVSPIIYGFLGDHVGIQAATVTTAFTALAIMPLALTLRTRLTPMEQRG
jgi:MFS family permease